MLAKYTLGLMKDDLRYAVYNQVHLFNPSNQCKHGVVCNLTNSGSDHNVYGAPLSTCCSQGSVCTFFCEVAEQLGTVVPIGRCTAFSLRHTLVSHLCTNTTLKTNLTSSYLCNNDLATTPLRPYISSCH